MTIPLFLATNNSGKILEIRAILGDLCPQLFTPADLGLTLDVDESGQTYAENAALKAQAFGRAVAALCRARSLPPMLVLADDSGLSVDVLNGEPGIHSARFAPQPGATDAQRRAHLIETLRPYPRPWKAHFHCTLVIATPAGELHFSEGQCHGMVIPEERGSNGFGYDPVFFIPPLGRTMAELSAENKNRLSHRARALQAARPVLQALQNA